MTNSSVFAPKLTAFQNTFGAYLRRQVHTELDVPPAREGQLYQSLIYNNLTTFVNQCFPICKAILDEQTWQALLQDFLENGEMHSPYFSEINEQFVQYLKEQNVIDRFGLPAFFVELAHYEWVELYVDNLPNHEAVSFMHYQDHAIALNPSVQALHYAWAVQTVSTKCLPDNPSDTFLLVYRKFIDNKYQTAFMSVSIPTLLLIGFIQENLGEQYADMSALFAAFAKRFDMATDHLLIFADDLFATMIDNQVFFKL